MSPEVPPPQKPRRAFDGREGYDLLRLVPLARGFVVRQFRNTPTRAQKLFDVLFVVVLPPILMILDRAWDPMDDGGVVTGMAYAFPMSVGAGLLLLLWFVRGERRHWSQALFAGAFAAAAFVSFGVGFLMLPYTFIGMFVLIGFLGFVPFLTSLSLTRTAIRALRWAQPDIDLGPAIALALTTSLIVLGGTAVQGLAAKRLGRRYQQVLIGARRGSQSTAERGLRILYRFPGVPLKGLEQAHVNAESDEERARIAETYARIAGREPDSPWD